MPSQPAYSPAQLRQKFSQQFGDAGRKISLARAPGRINLIGEHTDYNEGFAFPAAVNRATWVAMQRRIDTKVWVYSVNIDERIEFDLKILRNEREHGWANYVKAVLNALVNRGWKMEGLNIYVQSDVPLGGGMSSSAALECATAYAAMGLFPYTIDRLSVAKMCQRAENSFVGVNCGIMDQFASCYGKKGHALFLDCRTLKAEAVPLALAGKVLIIVNSGVKRKLASSEYNKRREQCQEAVKTLKPKFPRLIALRDLNPADLPVALPLLPEITRKRVEHVVRENSRVHHAVAALKSGDLAAVGRLLNETHASLKDLYEVSCPELDLLVSTAQQIPGVLGARMMGGGFGGCALILAEAAAADTIQHDLTRIYSHRYGALQPTEIVEPADGAAELTAA